MIIWLASYPRSGNTFLRVVLNSVFGLKTYSIYGDANDIAADNRTADVVGHEQLPADFDIDRAREAEALYLIKTHDYPPNSSDRAIYLVRDGREVMLSYLKYEDEFRDPHTSLMDVIYGNVPFGSWSRHLEIWNPDERQDTLLVRFEDLVDKPQEAIEHLSGFLGIMPTGGSVPTFAELHAINPQFFRSGKKDSWKTTFSNDEQAAFLLRHYSAMIAHGYTNDLPKAFRNPEDTTLLRQLSREAQYLQENVIATFRQQLERKDRLAQNQAELLGRKESRVEMLASNLEERKSRVEELKNNLLERQSRIDELKNTLTESQAMTRELKQELGTKTTLLGEVRDELDRTKDQLRGTRQELATGNDRLQTSERELDALRQSARQLLDELQLIRNSRRYKLAESLAQPYSRLRRKLSR